MVCPSLGGVCARLLAAPLAWLLALGNTPGLAQEPAGRKLNIIVIEGDGAINNIRRRTAREPIVQVEDENRRPVAGATVTFLLPGDGPGAALRDGSRSFTAITGPDGRAVLRGLRPNSTPGEFQIQVNASYQGITGSAVITQTNAAAAAGAAISGKLIAILAVAGGAAAAGGIVAATRGGNDTTTAPAPVIITPGTPSVGR
jgi:hypothetical protein